MIISQHEAIIADVDLLLGVESQDIMLLSSGHININHIQLYIEPI